MRLASLFRRSKENFVASALEDDMARLAEIHRESFSRPWSAGELSKLGRTKGATIWISRNAAISGPMGIEGFVLVRQAGDEAEIITIATARRARRSGVGRALIGHAIRELRRDGISRLFLEVSEANSPAIALYRRLGFSQVGRREAYYSQPGSDTEMQNATPLAALVMERDLG